MRRRVSGLLLMVLCCLLVGARGADAHSLPTSSALLTVADDHVDADLELPLDRLGVALQRRITPGLAAGAERAGLLAYVARHVSVSGADGRAWGTTVTNGRVEPVDGAPSFIASVVFTPPAGQHVTDFRLHDDVILEQLVTHRILVRLRSDFRRGAMSEGGRLLGVLDWDHLDIEVPAAGGSLLTGAEATARLGFRPVTSGADHLLFLLTLLLPAPLVARGRRW